MRKETLYIIASAAVIGLLQPAAAQVPEIRLAKQFSMGYLQLNVMEHRQLIEKHAKALGIPEVKVIWQTFNGPAAINDALLSGQIDIGSGGVPGLLVVWSKSKGTPQEIRGISALSSQPVLLIATFLAGFLVLGIQTGINAIGALIYPTSLRANGSGWQLGIGRIGSIVGPLAGALLIGWPVEHLYLWSAVPFVIAAITCFIVYRLNETRLATHPELREAQ